MSDSITIIYDGECPFCSNYVRLLRLKQNFDISLIDARNSQDPLIIKVKEQGYNLDEGMVALYNNEFYHGSDAVHFLALQSAKSNVFNKIVHWIFSSNMRAKMLYPMLRFGRNTALFVKGVKQIHTKDRDK